MSLAWAFAPASAGCVLCPSAGTEMAAANVISARPGRTRLSRIGLSLDWGWGWAPDVARTRNGYSSGSLAGSNQAIPFPGISQKAGAKLDPLTVARNSSHFRKTTRKSTRPPHRRAVCDRSSGRVRAKIERRAALPGWRRNPQAQAERCNLEGRRIARAGQSRRVARANGWFK